VPTVPSAGRVAWLVRRSIIGVSGLRNGAGQPWPGRGAISTSAVGQLLEGATRRPYSASNDGVGRENKYGQEKAETPQH
jgi:hypothetical protein